MNEEITHTNAQKRIEQFTDKGKGYLGFLHIAAQPLLFSTDLLYKLWLNFSTYAVKDDKPCRSYLVVSDLILSGICRPVGVNLFSLDEDIRQQLHNKLEAPIRKEVANFVNEYAEHNKTRLNKNIYEVYRIWATGEINPRKMENLIKEKLTNEEVSDYEKANYLSLYYNSMPGGEGKQKTNITLQAARNEYEKNTLNVKLPTGLTEKLNKQPKRREQTVSSDSAIELIKLAKKESWKRLDLGRTGLTELPDELFELKDLEELQLSNRIWDYRKFKWIDSPNTGKDNILTHLPNTLSKLENLETLYAGGDKITKWQINDISVLNNLSNLRVLYLNRNNISDISPIKALDNLRSLDLSNNKIEDISGLENFEQIQQLDLNNNEISDISLVENLKNLRVLYLNHNTISNISSLLNINDLNYLNLELNKIEDLSPVSHLITKGLPVLFEKAGVTKGIIVKDNPITNPPIEVLGQGNIKITEYFNELNISNEIEIEDANIFLLGSGGVGKTSLHYRLIDKNKSLPGRDEHTKQINIDKYRFSTLSEEDFTANIWDFGGQQIIHHFHRFFMTKSALYLLVIETSRDKDELDYWLQTIQLYAKESTILIVQNQMNGITKSFDINPFKHHYNIKDNVYKVNLLNNDGLEDLEKAIQYHLERLPFAKRTVPNSWININKRLQKEAKKNYYYITFERFGDICKEVANITNKDTLHNVADFLHQSGAILWYDQNPMLKQRVILKRNWVIEGIFEILFDEAIRKIGKFSREKADKILEKSEWHHYATPVLIEMMKEFKICIPTKSNLNQYLIPSLLKIPEPEHIQWQYPIRLTVEYQYSPMLPRELVNHFSAEMSYYIQEDDHVWNTGVWLNDINAQAKITANRFERKINVELAGENYRELFGNIKANIDNIQKDYGSLSYKLMIPCICSTCSTLASVRRHYYAYDNLIRNNELGRTTYVCPESFNDVLIKNLLGNIEITKKTNATKIFISYAPEDVTFKKRLEVELKTFLRNGNIQVFWIDHEILPDQNWHDEIEENLKTADLVFLLISDYFFASDYFYQKKLPLIRERYQKRDCTILPILVRPSALWENSDLSFIQAIPMDKNHLRLRPITQWENEDLAWEVVADEIRSVFREMPNRLSGLPENDSLELKQSDKMLDEYKAQNERTIRQLEETESQIDNFSTPLSDTEQPTKIFISYHRKDMEFKDELITHLSHLRRNGKIQLWDDQQILPATNWNEAINDSLEAADIIIFLVSPDFITSEYIHNIEISKAIERHKRGEVIILPIILKPCDFSSTPLAEFQALPKGARPLSKWEDRNEAWWDVVNGLKRIISEFESLEQTSLLNPLSKEKNLPKRKRLALVIGCGEYEHGGKLKNPLNDAQGMQEQLEALGFIVVLRENPNLRELKMAIDDFGEELKNFDDGLFYFAGQGVQVNGKNYLIPVDANLKEERFIEYDCVRADRVLIYMEPSNTDVNIIILDTFFNNPFDRRQNFDSLATMEAPNGALIAYATAPGKTASDGKGENGLYTGELIKHIQKKGITINEMFKQVRASVMELSNNKQIPWESSGLIEDFYFNP